MKKVLSFVLILALVLGSFSFAFGLSDVTEGDANSEAITVANDLGIVNGFPDGTFKADQAVTRAEFAAMITRALGVPESALAGFSATSFKDTSGYGWAVKYLAFCESKGIMIGDGYGNVMPGRTINVNEAMTMVLRTVGYTENSALLVGTWPAKYVTLAQDLDLYADVAAMVTVDRGNAAQIIYNALTVQKVQVDADGQTTGITGPGPAFTPVTMLTAGLNCEIRNGGEAEVVTYENDALINVMNYVGVYAKIYENSDDKIVAISEVGSVELTGTFDVDPGFAGSTVATALATAPTSAVFTATDGTEYKIVAGSTKVIDPAVAPTWDYVEFDNGSDGNLGAWTAAGGSNAYTINVKLSGKTVDTWYSTELWNVDTDGVIVDTDLLDIADGALFGEDFDLDANDKPIAKSFSLVGASSLDDIAVDDVVYVYTDGTEITKVEVGQKVVSGVVTKVSSIGDKVTIDGTVYKYAVDKVPGVAGAVATSSISAGDEVELTLDAHGYIYDFEKTSGTADKYAVVVNYANDTDIYGKNVVKIKMVLADGTIGDYDIDSGEATWAASLGAITAGGIVKYSLNKDGEVDDIVNQALTVQGTKAELSATGFYNGSAVESDAVYFTADVAVFTNTIGGIQWQDKDAYDVATFDTLKGAEFTAKYVIGTNGKVKAMLLDADATAAGAIYGVVIDKYTGTDADGDKAYYFTSLIDGVEVDYEVTFAEYGTITLATAADMQKLYKFEFNASGQADLTAVNPATLAAANAGSVATSVAAIASTSAISLSGNVVKVSDGAIAAGSLTANPGTNAFIAVDSSVVVYVFNTTDNVYEKKNLNTLRTTFNAAAAPMNLLFFVTDKDDFAVPNIALVW